MADPDCTVVGTLDRHALCETPLPPPADDADKNSRGRVFCVGGSIVVPGGIALTAEAAFRAGAGKVQIAAPGRLELALGMAMPEVAVFATDEDEDGGIVDTSDVVGRHAAASDAVVIGPAMASERAAGALVDAVLSHPSLSATVILDAAALLSLRARCAAVQACPLPKILTPHAGEMQALLGWGEAELTVNPIGAAQAAARRFDAVVICKGATTFVANPQGEVVGYSYGSVGLATGGSGDVLAGIVAGLAARGASGWTAALWAVWLHGEAGRACARDIGPVGFLARELLVRIPRLMAT